MLNISDYIRIVVGKRLSEIKPKHKIKPGIFDESPETIANYLKKKGGSKAKAIDMLNFYINRAGKNLSKERKSALHKTLKILEEKYSKEAKSKEMEKDLIEFFAKNPNPSDDQVHDWAEKQGYNVHKVEAAIYKLATKFVNLLSGGRAKEKGITEKDVDPKSLAQGIKIEMEHTNDKELAKKISLDHLAESPKYYEALLKMEKELEGKE